MKKRLLALLIAVAAASCAWAGNPSMFQGNASLFYYGDSTHPIVPVTPSTPMPICIIASGSSYGTATPSPVAVVMPASVSVPVQVDQNTGALTMTTYVVSVSADTPTYIGTYLYGKQGVAVNAFGGDILMGNGLASGTFYVGYRIASGTAATWSGLIKTATPTLYLLSNSGSAATATLQAW